MTSAATRIRTVVVGAMAAGGSRKETASNTCRDRVGEALDRGSLTYIGKVAETDKRGRAGLRAGDCSFTAKGTARDAPTDPPLGSRLAAAPISGPAETTFLPYRRVPRGDQVSEDLECRSGNPGFRRPG